jgi:hypothetical protein
LTKPSDDADARKGVVSSAVRINPSALTLMEGQRKDVIMKVKH